MFFDTQVYRRRNLSKIPEGDSYVKFGVVYTGYKLLLEILSEENSTTKQNTVSGGVDVSVVENLIKLGLTAERVASLFQKHTVSHIYLRESEGYGNYPPQVDAIKLVTDPNGMTTSLCALINHFVEKLPSICSRHVYIDEARHLEPLHKLQLLSPLTLGGEAPAVDTSQESDSNTPILLEGELFNLLADDILSAYPVGINPV